jgi:hypothetical protein
MVYDVSGVNGVEDGEYTIDDLRTAYNVVFGHTYQWMFSPLTESELATAIVAALKSGEPMPPVRYPPGALL